MEMKFNRVIIGRVANGFLVEVGGPFCQADQTFVFAEVQDAVAKIGELMLEPKESKTN